MTNNVAIAFLTKDRVELSRRTLEPLLQPDKFDLHWFDGSSTWDGKAFLREAPAQICKTYENVRGGPDAAVACALTTLLNHPANYEYIGLCENDVLLDHNWFVPTMALFQRAQGGLRRVGAVSPRAYEDRILFQRDGYAVMHNLGWGVQIMTRDAARLTLEHMRTGDTLENRRVFVQTAGKDIGQYWAFRAGEHALCADWHNDVQLAQSGFMSLALTPSAVKMIGQMPPLAEQGLTLSTKPVEWLRDDNAFKAYCNFTAFISQDHPLPQPHGTQVIFAHQIPGYIGGTYSGDWRLKWCQGFGPFAWKAARDFDSTNPPKASFRIAGPCQILVSGGPDGGQVRVCDLKTGYHCDPMLMPEDKQGLIGITVPAGISYNPIEVMALSPGVAFHGVKVTEPQPISVAGEIIGFDHDILPPVE